MNKKGMKPLIRVIIFFVVVIVLMLFLFNFKEKAWIFTEKNVCKTAVYTETSKQLVATPFQGIISLFRPKKKGTYEIPCPTNDITIKDKDKEIVKQKLANRMYDCLDNFLFGTKPLFEIKTGTEKYCIVCHHITFEGKAKSKFINAKDFDDFLNKTYINTPNALKDIYPEEKISYKQAFAGYITDEDALKVKEKEKEIKTEDYSIYTAIPYATIFTYTRKGYWSKWSTTPVGTFFGMAAGLILIPFTGGGSLAILGGSVLAGVGGGGIGYLLGHNKAADWDAGVILMPYAAVESEEPELKKLDCTYLPATQE